MTHTFELLSINQYYVVAGALECKIVSKIKNDAATCIVAISPRDFRAMEIDNSRLRLDNYSDAARRFIKKKTVLTETEIEQLLSDFNGMIIGYPFYRLSVNCSDGSPRFECDVIRIRKFAFTVDFISFDPSGKVMILKSYSTDDAGKSFEISKINKIGPIISSCQYNKFLSPSDLAYYIDGIKRVSTGYPAYDINDITGTTTADSELKSLTLNINFNSHTGRITFEENIYEKTYEVISHSSMNPWNDEITERVDRYLWATFIFDERTLIKFVKDLSDSSLVSYFDETKIEFVKPIKKSVFMQMTGIYLFESIVKSTERS